MQLFNACAGALLAVLALAAYAGDGGHALAAAGPPQADHFAVRILANHGFTVGYAPARRSAVWVVYRARAIGERRYRKRPDFAPDPRLADPVSIYAYFGTGFDRGHLAPNYLISNLYGPAAQQDSFLLSNVTPQRPRFNQLLWQRLEEVEADYAAPRSGALRVTVGPVFGPHPQRIDDGPAIAKAFYRLWLDQTASGGLRAIALLVPQSVRGDERLDSFVVSVDRVEAQTGLDFYPNLADAIQVRIEAEAAKPGAWGLSQIACLPARYREDWQGRGGIELNFDRCGE